jgi:hypothetical protein
MRYRKIYIMVGYLVYLKGFNFLDSNIFDGFFGKILEDKYLDYESKIISTRHGGVVKYLSANLWVVRSNLAGYSILNYV